MVDINADIEVYDKLNPPKPAKLSKNQLIKKR